MDFRIVNVVELDCHMIVTVEHYHDNDSFWFTENYRWRGVEGAKHRRVVDSDGDYLMDDGSKAPTTPNVRAHLGEVPDPYLPEGRDWMRHATPTMDNESIYKTIRLIHSQRLVSGWPQGQIDVVSRMPEDNIRVEDRNGCHALVAKFQPLIGYSE
jgi:hypothetical protein